MRTWRSVLLAIVPALLWACDRPPIKWDLETQRFDDASVQTAGPRWRLEAEPWGAVFVRPSASASVREASVGCPGSIVVTVPGRAERFAGWWRSRPDSSVMLMVAHSTDSGATWSMARAADERDRGRRGCHRPPPAIAIDTVAGFVHLAYYLEPQEGAGVWLIHSMEHGAMWHSPVAVAFGGDPSAADVAADRDRVVVAYESPNQNEGWIGLAFSSTDGHLIDWRLAEVSGRSVPVDGPRVALAGRLVAVAWVTQRGSMVMLRTGLLQ